MSSQKPRLETFTISTSEVRFPSFADFIFAFLNEPLYRVQGTSTQATILRQFDPRLQPEFCLPLRSMHMDVHACFFAREEKETIGTATKDRWAHVFLNRILRVPGRRFGVERDQCECFPLAPPSQKL